MNQQVKEKWLSSLRSGDYKQTQCHLHTNYGFCCLGVLCDLYGKEHNVEWELVNDEDYNYYVFQDEKSILPLSVIEWAGVEDDNPEICETPLSQTPLSRLNDNGSTFNEIADLIQKHL